jgi:hypothetical protein
MLIDNAPESVHTQFRIGFENCPSQRPQDVASSPGIHSKLESIGVILVHPKMNLKLHIVGRIRLRHIRITALALKLVTGSLLHSKQLLKKKET